jgi:hypothetical protein
MFAVSSLFVRYHSLNFSTKVAATVQPTRPRPETKEQRNKAGYEAEESDEDEFFDVSIVLTWFSTLYILIQTLHHYRYLGRLPRPRKGTTEQGANKWIAMRMLPSSMQVPLLVSHYTPPGCKAHW